MIIVLKQDAPKEKVHEFCTELEGMGLQINDSKGSDTHILGLIGDTKAIAESWVLANPVVETCRRVSEPYKKANRKFHPDDSVRSRSPTAPSASRQPVLPCCAAVRSSPALPPTPSRGCVARVSTCSSWPAVPPVPPSSPRS